MLQHNFLTYIGKITLQIIGEILYFPIWWYTVGFLRLLKGVGGFWRDQEQSLGFLVWAKNWFRPMYGQYDWAGRIISFFVRTVQIIFRAFILAIWLILLIIILLLWLAAPVLLLLALAFQFLK